MPSFNRVIMAGHLTRDPERRTLPSGTALCEFGLACNRKFKTADGRASEEVCFIDCAAFGRVAEVMAEHLARGRAVLVEGRIKYDVWERDGQKRSKHGIIVENFQFLGGRGDGPRQERPASQAPPPAVYDAPDDDDENIPF